MDFCVLGPLIVLDNDGRGVDAGQPLQRALLAIYSAEKYERLVAVKDRYDPTNRFHINHNIVPSAP